MHIQHTHITLPDLLDMHLCTRSLYDKLAPNNASMQGTSFYFAKSAIAANNIHWLREVAVDFGATLSDFCSMARLYALEQLPLLQQPFEEDGVTLWLLDRYAINYDPIMYARGGHLGMLQLILGKRGVCSHCIALTAAEAGELHIVAWCRHQDWTPCAKHSIQA
ncbi:hypothetical protein RI367_006515 [Sorochytrium milnesiophthora]